LTFWLESFSPLVSLAVFVVPLELAFETSAGGTVDWLQ
jgi:hypothetical protein